MNYEGADTPKVVLEALDKTTLCINRDVVITVLDPKRFLQILEIGDLQEIKNNPLIVSQAHLDALQEQVGLRFRVYDNEEITIRGLHWLDRLSYKSHTRRELVMMLEKKKPLAVFEVYTAEGLEQEVFAEEVFDAYVRGGMLVKAQEFITDDKHPSGPITSRRVLYALKEEQWRIKAFLLLRQVTRNLRWNDSFELILGVLLGYSEAECHEYLALKNSELGFKIW